MRKRGFYAAILSGGSGERFWPLSTPEHPKQFLTVFGGKSLLRQSVDRLKGLVPPERILIVTAKSLARATYRELPEIPKSNILLEPCRRDTAAAVATACTAVERMGGEDAVVAVLTADQLMGDVGAFRRVLSVSADAAAKSEDIVTMGVKPTYPATGFGYIRVGRPCGDGVCRAERFVEKPDLATAKRYVRSGKYVWNAGMFVWKVSTLKGALAAHAPQLVGIECPGGPLAAYAAQIEQTARGEDEEGHAYGGENGRQGGAEAMVLAGGHIDQLHMKHHHQHDAQPAHQAQPLQSFRRMVARRHRHLSLRWLSCTRCPCCRRQWQFAPYTLRSPRGDP